MKAQIEFHGSYPTPVAVKSPSFLYTKESSTNWIWGRGSKFNPLIVETRKSAAQGNVLQILDDGLFVPPSDELTQEAAQQAVGSILNSQEFNYNPTTPSITINQIDWSKIVNAPSTLEGPFRRLANFVIGEGGYSPGFTTYTNSQIVGKTEADLMVFVNGIKLYAGRSNSSFNVSGSSVVFTEGLINQTVEIYAIAQPVTPEPPVLQAVRYGAKGTAAIPTQSEILAGLTLNTVASGVVTVDWTSLTISPQYCWVAIPALGASYLKTKWDINPLNFGNIGNPGDLFSPVSTVNVNGELHYVTITTYQTQFVEPTKLIP